MIIRIIFLVLIISYTLASDHFHQSSDQYKTSLGWREPGLWRPKWILDRVIDANEDGPISKPKRDRIVFKLKSDRSMKIYSTKNRPLIELFKRKEGKKKKLFETGDEEVLSLQEEWKRSRAAREKMDDIDGTWWWKDEGVLGLVKLEVREGKEDSDRTRHDIRCEWGNLDGYAANFRKRGKVLKYKMTSAGVPIGEYPIGSFTIRVSPHRPMVSKEYIAFQ